MSAAHTQNVCGARYRKGIKEMPDENKDDTETQENENPVEDTPTDDDVQDDTDTEEHAGDVETDTPFDDLIKTRETLETTQAELAAANTQIQALKAQLFQATTDTQRVVESGLEDPESITIEDLFT